MIFPRIIELKVCNVCHVFKKQWCGSDQTVDNKPEMLEVSKNMHNSYFYCL